MDYNDPLRRDGRAVECTGLENQQALIGLPGFESLSYRFLKGSTDIHLAFYYLKINKFN